MRLFSTEQVSKYHPDKYADQISDAILDACIDADPRCRVACECMVKGKTVILAGEITARGYIDYASIARRVGQKLGYEVDTVIQQITQQSPEISGGIRSGPELGAGDQGIMYGYACDDTPEMLPYGFSVANRIINILELSKEDDGALKGDAKCQVTVDLDAEKGPGSLKKILVSACHQDWLNVEQVRRHIRTLIKNLVDIGSAELIINPAGAWTLGGPEADCGLTGRKIVCDQYGGYIPVGGGAFSGKDPSKVDRSAAYMARRIACDLLRQHDLRWCEVQLGYAIGMKEPMSVCVLCDNAAQTQDYSEEVRRSYDLSPAWIIKNLDLLNVKYETLAEGCHYRANREKANVRF